MLTDVRTFLARLDRVARRRVFVCLGAGSADLRTDPLWRYFHGRPRPPAPTYLDAVAVLRELDIDPQVEIVEVAATDRYATVTEAVDDHLDLLRLEDADDVRNRLSALLETLADPQTGRDAAGPGAGPAGRDPDLDTWRERLGADDQATVGASRRRRPDRDRPSRASPTPSNKVDPPTATTAHHGAPCSPPAASSVCRAEVM